MELHQSERQRAREGSLGGVGGRNPAMLEITHPGANHRDEGDDHPMDRLRPVRDLVSPPLLSEVPQLQELRVLEGAVLNKEVEGLEAE